MIYFRVKISHRLKSFNANLKSKNPLKLIKFFIYFLNLKIKLVKYFEPMNRSATRL